MRYKAFKYASPLLIFIPGLMGFYNTGIWCWWTLIYAWIIIPVAELLIPANEKNLSEAEVEMAKHDKVYDWILYAIVACQFVALFVFLNSFKQIGLTNLDITGRILSMGMLCGTFGINVGHELGHRINKFEQLLAKASLMTSLYMHFFIEHNKGHHKNVATPNDPSSAHYGEAVYLFYFRTIVFSYTSAWHIANTDMKKKGKNIFSIDNEMIRAHIIQIIFLSVIVLFFGWKVTAYYLAAAFVGILLLETVNYIEHYGLSRKETSEGKFERAMPAHSWNSNHVVGRVMLFELSRHSDHHYLASKKYQLLEHHDHAPQMPTGYPGMMILSLIPPAWFYVMNRRIKAMQEVNSSQKFTEAFLLTSS
jgi:alkane 1-monooxygenase